MGLSHAECVLLQKYKLNKRLIIAVKFVFVILPMDEQNSIENIISLVNI